MKSKLIPLAIGLMGLMGACASSRIKSSSAPQPAATFDFEAHRGGRGLMPENTIPAMRNAVNMASVQTLEMDVVITKDGEVLVSHDPYLNANITTAPDGKYLTAQEGQQKVLYQMNYSEIRTYDVGVKPHPDFPQIGRAVQQECRDRSRMPSSA
eukprot:TRINITY_DN41896_c0_g1_i1.p2 TRINITY_DN41896_c0_g1~~TRINITY_DN41896_c0_g1_i1.p2  ORF type:complete len:154 (-),score=31.57 TRINITY_DN41896_c0_g1_i1:10-471(-)